MRFRWLMATRPIRCKIADLDALMPSLTQAVRERGAINHTQLTQLGVPKAQHQAAASRLCDEGFETTTKAIRLPIRQQLGRRLQERSQLPLKGLEKLVIGCTAKEVLTVVEEFVNNGIAHRILRTKAEWIVTADTDVLSTEEVKGLGRLIADWAARTKKTLATRKTPLTFWRNDIRALIEELMLMKNGRRPSADVERHDSQRLLRVILENLQPTVGLAFVPTVIEKSQLAVERAQGLLLELARSGAIELRPDAGAVRFSEEELRIAPAGPDGSHFFWVRLLKEAI